MYYYHFTLLCEKALKYVFLQQLVVSAGIAGSGYFFLLNKKVLVELQKAFFPNGYNFKYVQKFAFCIYMPLACHS